MQHEIYLNTYLSRIDIVQLDREYDTIIRQIKFFLGNELTFMFILIYF